jgi:molecular chaperone GrpE
MPSSRANEGDRPAQDQLSPEPGQQAREVTSEAPPGGEQEPRDGATVAEAELARMEDRYKRALADLDNYRKRAGREVERRVEESRESLMRDWLEVVDSVERALRMAPDRPLFEGLRSVLDQMEAVLARHGIKRVGSAGEPFDPQLHEAVEVRMTDEVPDRTVVEVVRSGFALGDRVLRPAQVVVARRPEPER